MIAVHRFATRRFGVLAAIAVMGCETPTVPPQPSFSFINGPPSPNPVVIRVGNAGSRVITTDPAEGLLAIHGKVLDLNVCTNASTRVPVDFQIVRTPADAQATNLLLQGRDNEVVIYDHGDISDLSPFDPVKFCAFIAVNTPAYTGNVAYRLHANGQGNLLFQWEGFVSLTADGSSLHYVEQQYAVPRPDGTLEFLIEDMRFQRGGP
jgi:hypothetical protein